METYRDSIPRADKDTVESLVCPEFPNIVESERRLGDTNTTPSREHEDEERILRRISIGNGRHTARQTHNEQHCFGSNDPSLLDHPEDTDTTMKSATILETRNVFRKLTR